MASIRQELVNWGNRIVLLRHFRAKSDKRMIATCLNWILQSFSVSFVAWAVTVTNFPLPEGTYECKHNCFSLLSPHYCF